MKNYRLYGYYLGCLEIMSLLGAATSLLAATVSAIGANLEGIAIAVAGMFVSLFTLAIVVIGNVLIDIYERED